MTLKINDDAPDFEAETTEGRIRFHDWIGDSWAVLFSHPKNFTPVCTTELGYMAKIKPEFDRRNVKIIGLSVDPVDSHASWASDIAETQGYAPNYPVIGDADFAVSKLYEMLPVDTSGDAAARTPADNQTVRNVFAIGPDKKIKLVLVYPMTTGRNFDEVLRVIDSLQLTARHKVATPVNWQQGDDVIIAGSVSDDEDVADGLVVGRRALQRVARRLGRQHPVQLGDVEVGVADDRVLGLGALGLLDVLRPVLVAVDRVDRQADDLDVALVELGLDLGHVSELGRADRREVLGVAEEHAPRVAQPLVEVDRALSGLGGEVGGGVAQSQ